MPEQDIKIMIGRRIKAAREARNLSQETLAESLDVSSSMLSRVETGKEMTSVVRLYRISQVLDIEFSYLFEDLSSDTPDSIELEIINRVRHMSSEEKKHILDYMDLLEKYKIQNDS